MNFKIYILSFTACLLFSDLQAQPGTTTEAEVEIQATFIEGNREKILGNYDKAVDKYKEVLKKKPNHPAVNYELARVYDVLDEDESALKAIKTAVEQDETNMWYRMFLGDVYQKMEKNTEAADVFKALVQDYPDEEHHYLKQAFFLVKAKKTAEAVKAYDQMEKRFGITEEFIRRKHTLYVGMGDNKKAAKELNKLIAMFPDNTDYLHLLAGFYDQIGEAEQAKSMYNKILQVDAQDAKAQLALAGGGVNKNDDVTYLNSLKSIFNNENEEIDTKIKALFPYITKAAESKNPALSNATIELAAILCRVHPTQAKAFSIHGDLLYHTNQPLEALAMYEKTLELDNSVYAVWEQILYIHAETGNTDGLIASSNDAIDLFPNQAKTYYFQGIGQMNKANHQAAITAFQQAALMSRKNPALKLEVLTKMAIEYTTLKKYEAAKKQLDKATEMRADDYRVFDAQGYWHTAQGETAEAEKFLDKALAKGGNDPLVLEHYGDLQAALGKTANATKYWNKAIEKGGDKERLGRKIED